MLSMRSLDLRLAWRSAGSVATAWGMMLSWLFLKMSLPNGRSYMSVSKWERGVKVPYAGRVRGGR